MSTTIKGGNSAAGIQNVETFAATVNTPGYRSNGVPSPSGDEFNAGAAVIMSENDNDAALGARTVRGPETDDDYRLRVAQDNMLDQEAFNYAAQNTAKHSAFSTTMVQAIGTNGLQLNTTSIVTANTGVLFHTNAWFPVGGTLTTVNETSVAFSAQPVANQVIDFGMFIKGAANPYAPVDGAHFRITAAGLVGVVNYNGVETVTPVFPLALGAGVFVYANNAVNRYLVQITNVHTTFWVNNVKYGEIKTPTGLNIGAKASSMQWGIRMANTATAGGAQIVTVLDYRIFIRGAYFPDSLGVVNNRVLGSYQGLSGWAMGSLAAITNNTAPTAGVPTNTTSTVIVNALGGFGYETDTLGVNIDGIIMSYLVAAPSVSIPGRRLRVNGIDIDGFVQTALVGGGYNALFQLAFGHTGVSLLTAESVNTKAPRRIACGSHGVAAGAAALTQLSTIHVTLVNPIYVNPGEYIQLIKRKVGTAPTGGVIAWSITLDYSWE